MAQQPGTATEDRFARRITSVKLFHRLPCVVAFEFDIEAHYAREARETSHVLLRIATLPKTCPGNRKTEPGRPRMSSHWQRQACVK